MHQFLSPGAPSIASTSTITSGTDNQNFPVTGRKSKKLINRKIALPWYERHKIAPGNRVNVETYFNIINKGNEDKAGILDKKRRWVDSLPEDSLKTISETPHWDEESVKAFEKSMADPGGRNAKKLKHISSILEESPDASPVRDHDSIDGSHLSGDSTLATSSASIDHDKLQRIVERLQKAIPEPNPKSRNFEPWAEGLSTKARKKLRAHAHEVIKSERGDLSNRQQGRYRRKYLNSMNSKERKAIAKGSATP
jgi:hypothetical protein